MEQQLSPTAEVFQLEEIVEIILAFVVDDGRVDDVLCLRPVCKLWKKVCFKLFQKLQSFPLKLNLRMEPEEQAKFLCNITTHCYIPMEIELRSNGVIEPQELMLLEMYGGNVVIVTFAGDESVEATESLLSNLSLPRLKLVHLELPAGSLSYLPNGQLAATVDDVMTSTEGLKLCLFIYCPPEAEDDDEFESPYSPAPKFPSLRTTGMTIDFEGPCQSDFVQIFSNFHYIDTLTNLSLDINGKVRNKDAFTIVAKRLQKTLKSLTVGADVLDEPPVLKLTAMSNLEFLAVINVSIDTFKSDALLPDLLPKLQTLGVNWINVPSQIQTVQRFGKHPKQFPTVKSISFMSMDYKGNYDSDSYAADLIKMLDNFPNLESLSWLKLTDLLAQTLLPLIFNNKINLRSLNILIENPNKFPVLPVYDMSRLIAGKCEGNNLATLEPTSSITNLKQLRFFNLTIMNLDVTIEESASEALLSMKRLSWVKFNGNVKVFPTLLDAMGATGKQVDYIYYDNVIRDYSDEDDSDADSDEDNDEFEEVDEDGEDFH